MKRLYSLLFLLLMCLGSGTVWADSAVVTDETSIGTTNSYYLQNPRGFLYATSADATTLSVSTTKNGTTNPSLDDASILDKNTSYGAGYQFIIYKSSDTQHTYIYNVLTGKFLYKSGTDRGNVALGTASQAANFTIDCDAITSNSNYLTTIKVGTDYLSISNWQPYLATFSTLDNGCYWAIMDTWTAASTDVTSAAIKAVSDYEISAVKAELAQYIAQAKRIKNGTTLGTYSNISDNALSTLATAISEAETSYNSSDATYSSISTAITKLSAAMTTAVNGATLNTTLPTNGGFYRIRTSILSNTSQPYLLSTTQNGRIAIGADNSSNQVSSIFYLGSGSNIVNYSTGYYVTYNGVHVYYNGVTDKPVSVTFETPTVTEVGCYSILYKYDTTTTSTDASGNTTTSTTTTSRYLYASNGYTDCWSAKSSLPKQGNFVIEAVDELPVTVSSLGYATFNSPVPVTVPTNENLKVYTATNSETSGYIKLTLVEGGKTLAANTPVILIGSEGSYDFAIAESGDVSATTPLKGTVAAETTTASSNLTLQVTDRTTPGFYKYSGTTLYGFRAYIPITTSTSDTGSLKFSFDDDATAITSIETTPQDGQSTIYDLSGRRVNKAAHGLYIVNGQKVILK